MPLSSIPSWCVQRIASLSLVAIIVLLYLALWRDTPPRSILDGTQLGNSSVPLGRTGQGDLKISKAQLVFVCYTIFAHLLGLLFPIRLCWATWGLTKQLAKASQSAEKLAKVPFKDPLLLSEKLAAIEVFEDSCSSSSSDSETLCNSPVEISFLDIPLHAIIIPNYKEDIETLKETLEVLACHPQASTTYEVCFSMNMKALVDVDLEICLAMEENEKRCKGKAAVLVKQFKDQFRSIEFTVHPANIPGEAQGKSSNLAWAAQYLRGKYEAEKLYRSVIVTVIDGKCQSSRVCRILLIQLLPSRQPPFCELLQANNRDAYLLPADC